MNDRLEPPEAEPLSNAARRGGRWAWTWAAVASAAAFALAADWTMPGVNEAHYLAKARHFWRPDWLAGDFFLQSADAHWTFYVTLGWLAHLLSLPAAAWMGRALTWGLLGWSWARLTRTFSPVWWTAPASAVLMLGLLDHFHLAGEWLAGGFEAKGLAYVFLFLALAQAACSQWPRAWLWLGAASAFHVLVGGWSVLALGAGWLCDRRRRWGWPFVLCLTAGGLISLIGLWPAAQLDLGAPADVKREAHQLYVYWRLPHHLYPPFIPKEVQIRFCALAAVWFAVCGVRVLQPRWGKIGRREARLQRFAAGALALAGVGAAASGVDLKIWVETGEHPVWGAELLRFYWFRLSDAMIPAGLAWAWVALTTRALAFGPGNRPQKGFARAAAVVGGLCAAGFACEFAARKIQTTPDSVETAWRDACGWARNHTPSDASFLTPRGAATFRWHAERAEAASWKDVPQDAQGVVAWRDRFLLVHRNPANGRWFEGLGGTPEAHLQTAGRRLGARYMITENPPHPTLPLLYGNDHFSIHALPP